MQSVYGIPQIKPFQSQDGRIAGSVLYPTSTGVIVVRQAETATKGETIIAVLMSLMAVS